MENVYLVSQKTKAILLNDSNYYRSVVIEADSQLYLTHKAEDIINHSCIIYGATLEGRRGAVKKILKSMSKLPIAISSRNGIYMFPTASNKNKDCVWLAYHHIKDYFVHNEKPMLFSRRNRNICQCINQYD
ncbi:hypothetical protein CV093_18815 [Oceanobacillus sp. 143]|nr:hypothetical protein CV093_18815 [Oceanobacillus sp. 143]